MNERKIETSIDFRQYRYKIIVLRAFHLLIPMGHELRHNVNSKQLDTEYGIQTEVPNRTEVRTLSERLHSQNLNRMHVGWSETPIFVN